MENLLAIRQLQPHTAEPAAIRKLLGAARRNLADARVDHISPDNRFDAAYKCVMQCAMLGLWARGYRTSTSQPGHHQTAIQCLVHTMGVAKDDIIVLDALRRQRNVTDYEGDPVSEATLAEALVQAAKLLAHTETWLRANRPDTIGDT
ncbi:DNA-binding protein [Luteimonas sp. RD2P54]|uniref:DNA-binding protein n=1 Tax=Luteimonas endophytica TaxID=3042023 RepID=A0ABT6J593_9GAMM|nr:DNA-binding protein [Luteimonas endophytica]MDH5821722.1 DNA-binding protein [Luteimonas endophytica]